MSFRYQKRVHLGKGANLNFSKSGVSFSKRTRFGSVGTQGFSIRTGIPGLTFRKSLGKGSTGLIVYLVLGGFVLSFLIVYNLVRLLVFGFVFLIKKVKRKSENH